MKKKILMAAIIGIAALSVYGCKKEAENAKTSGSAVSETASKSAVKTTDYKASDYVTELGEYTGVEYTKADTEVTDDEIEGAVKSFLESNPVKVTDRAVKSGDTVNIDFEGKKDGVAFEGGTSKGFNLTIGSHKFIDGFEDGLIGHKEGETVTLNLKFPDNYRAGSELNGAAVVFTVKINSISESAEEITDELVKEHTDFKTVAEYKESLKNDLKATKEEKAKNGAHAEIIGKILEKTKIKDAPEGLLNVYIKQFKDYHENLAASNGVTLKEFLEKAYGMDEAAFETKCKEYAENMAKQLLVIKVIAEKENITLSDEDYQKGLKEYYDRSGLAGKVEMDAYEKQIGKEAISDVLLTDKVVDFLIEKGKPVEAAKGSESK